MKNDFRLYGLSFLLALTIGVNVCTQCYARKGFDKSTAEPSQDNLKQGLLLVRQGNYEAAADSFQQAIYFSRNNYNPDAWKYLGLCYKAMRSYPKAIEAINTHIKQTTEPAPDAYLDLAEMHINMNDFDKARDLINKAYIEVQQAHLKDDQKSQHRQKYMFGYLHEKMGDAKGNGTGSALNFYEGAINDKPLYTQAWLGKARVQVKEKQYNDALRTYRQILDKGPLMRNVNFEELYYNMGQCLYKRGDHQGALDRWRMALEANPESHDAHLALATMFDEERHFSSAIKEYEATLRSLSPENGAERQKIMRRMQWLEQQTREKEAPEEVRPSPAMRQEFDEVQRQKEDTNKGPVPKDSGF